MNNNRTVNRLGLGILVCLLLVLAYSLGVDATVNHYETLACKAQGYDTALVSPRWLLKYDVKVTCFKTTLATLELK